MNCTTHPEVETDQSCALCKKPFCERCLSYEVDERVACGACGLEADERSRSLGAALLTLIGVGYLLTLALAYMFFRGRPFVGGLAAVLSIGLGRVLQMYVIKPPIVARRVDVPTQAR